MARDLLLLLLVVPVWVMLLSTWYVRNWRGVLAAGAATLTVVILEVSHLPLGGFIESAACGLTLYSFWFHPEPVTVMSRSEFAFVVGYIRQLKRMAAMKKVESVDGRRYQADFSSVISGIRELDAPNDWAAIQADSVRELEHRLAMMPILTARPDAALLERIDNDWVVIQLRVRALLRSQSSFWRGAPFRRPLQG